MDKRTPTKATKSSPILIELHSGDTTDTGDEMEPNHNKENNSPTQIAPKSGNFFKDSPEKINQRRKRSHYHNNEKIIGNGETYESKKYQCQDYSKGHRTCLYYLENRCRKGDKFPIKISHPKSTLKSLETKHLTDKHTSQPRATNSSRMKHLCLAIEKYIVSLV